MKQTAKRKTDFIVNYNNMSANEHIFKSQSRSDVEASASRVEKFLTGKFISKKECLKLYPTWLVGLIAMVRKY